MSYEADWKAAKKQFENATGKKKPSDKFLGVFRESSGIEGACKKLDQSLADPSEENVTKAMAAFDKAMMAYMTTLEKAEKSEKGENYKSEVSKLGAALEAIRLDYAKQIRGSQEEAPHKLSDLLGPSFKEMKSEEFRKTASVEWFDSKEAITDFVDPKNTLPAAVAFQKKIDEFLTHYVGVIDHIGNQASKLFTKQEAASETFSSLREIDTILKNLHAASTGLKAAHEKNFATQGKGEGDEVVKKFRSALPDIWTDIQKERTRIANLAKAINSQMSK